MCLLWYINIVFPLLKVEYEDFTLKNDAFIGIEEKDILICRLGKCKKKFLDNEALRSHRLLEHGVELRYITDRIFLDKKSFDDRGMAKKEQRYMKMSDIPRKIEKCLPHGFFCPFVRSNEDIIICSIDNCNRKFTDPEELDAHISLVHEESFETVRYFQCYTGKCEKKFLDNEALRSHRLLEHGVELRYITDRIFLDKKSFDDRGMAKKEQRYMKMSDIPRKIEKCLPHGFFCPFVRSNEDIIICSIDNCNRKFTDPEELDAHISLVHEESFETVRYFQCYTGHTHITMRASFILEKPSAIYFPGDVVAGSFSFENLEVDQEIVKVIISLQGKSSVEFMRNTDACKTIFIFTSEKNMHLDDQKSYRGKLIKPDDEY
uniref:C2H2-type domain-containing protein n=1 Tax=Strongyloides papillosus TaxID=174720 RepID=A0A0N5BHI9_STREA